MWLFTAKGFVSIVKHPARRDRLIVRARVNGDIQRVITLCGAVFETPDNDYRYRALINREVVANAIVDEHLMTIDYPNFKEATPKWRHPYYVRVWDEMYQMQEDRLLNAAS